jgi:hypothetical protein
MPVSDIENNSITIAKIVFDWMSVSATQNHRLLYRTATDASFGAAAPTRILIGGPLRGSSERERTDPGLALPSPRTPSHLTVIAVSSSIRALCSSGLHSRAAGCPASPEN